MTYSALFSVSFLCSNVKFMTFVYSVSALEVLLVYTALYKLSFIIIIIIIIGESPGLQCAIFRVHYFRDVP